ncbi:hypothetical protein [Magnetospirillum fulvum]|uniref:Uncharacterized protein n=1 Tax=Magnetospirillum fulvum MGU-K5 TaxID=1316936 RepID=S9TFZ1_MAGFU|nr:hypothetical protein [Magnetospirillum fulvum]EPY01171.1 hypothetical protein K678_12207 [Magnetospirillum fulvum MGU-K5]
MSSFQLFRFRLHKPRQVPLFPKDLPAQDVLREALLERPLLQTRNAEWRIGNVEVLDANGLYFKLGRRQEAIKETVREGDFEDAFSDETVSTHIILDVNLEVCAIFLKPELSQSVGGLANRLKALVQNSKAVSERQIDVEIDPIKNPESFIKMLREAYRIESFRFTVTRPNIIDTESLFVKPTQDFIMASSFGEAAVTLKDAKGEQGGDIDVLEPIVRNAAATGQDVSARVRTKKGSKPTNKHLNKNYVTDDIGDADPKQDAKGVISTLRNLYDRIRQSDDKRS